MKPMHFPIPYPCPSIPPIPMEISSGPHVYVLALLFPFIKIFIYVIEFFMLLKHDFRFYRKDDIVDIIYKNDLSFFFIIRSKYIILN